MNIGGGNMVVAFIQCAGTLEESAVSAKEICVPKMRQCVRKNGLDFEQPLRIFLPNVEASNHD